MSERDILKIINNACEETSHYIDDKAFLNDEEGYKISPEAIQRLIEKGEIKRS
ncbi:MAG: hypothetical protein J7K26_02350 [Candidatus Aenigmarchaeota archaeon]|nr:hypothetical protein [Candidatus Aenigmarchaeota archaeon]